MQNIFPATLVVAVIVIAGWLAWGSMNPAPQPLTALATTSLSTTSSTKQTAYECDGDAKMCSDGSTVGRTGASCEFADCPLPSAKSATIRTTMGQKMTGLGVTITPMEVTDDSRCPTDVQCIWAGTAHVRAAIKTSAGTRTEVLEIGNPIDVDGYTITFTELTPAPHSGETIPDSSYRFVFSVSKD